jgi:uncharacterized damage-inducible protein DinB
MNTIAQLLSENYNGKPWMGISTLDVLADITPDMAIFRNHAKDKNIFDYVWHIVSWRRFAIERLGGNDSYDIELNSDLDWTNNLNPSQNQWLQLREILSATQVILLRRLAQAPPTLLEQTVKGKDYTYFEMLHGIVQHDIYHLGQIVMAKKVAKNGMVHLSAAA